MIQSTSHRAEPPGLHVAIIMDGNGRWAGRRGLPRAAGHRAGAQAVRRVVEAAPGLGIGTLTLFAFSSDNWLRPPHEAADLMRHFQDYLCLEKDRCAAQGVRVSVIGRRDRLPLPLRAAIEAAEATTVRGRLMQLRIAIDYSGRDALLEAARRFRELRAGTQEAFARLLAEVSHANASTREVDLIIRTGGEQRLSDFLLWECAYAELFFTQQMWPDFDASDLEAAIKEFRARERRFGRIPEAAAS